MPTAASAALRAAVHDALIADASLTSLPLSAELSRWAMLVLTAYFGGRSIEKVARMLAKK